MRSEKVLRAIGRGTLIIPPSAIPLRDIFGVHCGVEKGFEELLTERLSARLTLGELIDPLLAAAQAYAESRDVGRNPERRLGPRYPSTGRRLRRVVGGDPSARAPILASVRWYQHTAREGTVSGELDRRESIRLYERAIAEIPEFPLDSVPRYVRALAG